MKWLLLGLMVALPSMADIVTGYTDVGRYGDLTINGRMTAFDPRDDAGTRFLKANRGILMTAVGTWRQGFEGNVLAIRDYNLTLTGTIGLSRYNDITLTGSFGTVMLSVSDQGTTEWFKRYQGYRVKVRTGRVQQGFEGVVVKYMGPG